MSPLTELFLKGGPIMWPLLILSIAALTIVVERFVFVLAEARRGSGLELHQALQLASRGDWPEVHRVIGQSPDPIARVLREALTEPESVWTPALQRGAERELQRQARGLTWLDTCITAAPLLGLLGTVTGMIRAFSLVGGSELGAPTAITGGIAEALIATSFGLGIALIALFPFNYLTARLERFRHQLQDACTAVEIASQKARPTPSA